MDCSTLSPAQRHQAVEHVRDALGREEVSERRACRVLGQRGATHSPTNEPRLEQRLVELASQYVRYGDLRVMALLCQEGWSVNHQRVERLW